MLNKIIGIINESLYSYILIILLIAGGVYFSAVTGFVQFRRIGQQFKSILEKPTNKKGVSPFQALIVSTASRVGTGNIIGVSSAICMGGFGSVFWMWLIAIIGSASAYAESTLAQIFKKRGKDGCYGGPAYYIETLNLKPLALVFTICLILTYGFGFNMLASFNLQSTFSGYGFYNENYTPWIIGAIVALAVAFCLFGGGRGIIKVTEFLV
ncbi:MAG: alanine:cation symporter family protein, partial [Clostridia bacterium]|nr:alanine:cation symporter family protein [Clostridia bacterium]